MTDRAPQTQDKYVIRFTDGLRNRVKKAAMENNRSMNAEIIATLEDKYPAPDEVPQEILDIISRLRRGTNSDDCSISMEDFGLITSEILKKSNGRKFLLIENPDARAGEPYFTLIPA